ncbi:MAG: lipopolysaccharide transport periplasmic protein LptA [Zoogloeaceae bacterium]|jgi:lipopolysaccharide export system protein LptA|nr:lipopolysaccharide transport periplasmic protein LptA [Zoogloeaceae bacterium]
MYKRLNAFFLLMFFLLPGTLPAEQGDRKQPLKLEADRITVDDIKGEQILEGNVVLTQGTLVIQSSRIVITEDQHGFQHGVAYGGPGGLARFRQKRDDGAWVEGKSERIEYNTRTEVAELFQRAWIKNGKDELRGEYIWYDGITARYLAASGKENAKSGRVTAIIQPRNADAPAPELPMPASLPGVSQDFPERPSPR